MIDVRFLQTAVGGTRVRTPKAVVRVALNKGRHSRCCSWHWVLCHNRKSRRHVWHVRAASGSSRPRRWLLVLHKRVLTYPRVERATGASYRGTMTRSIRRKLATAGECTINAPTISAQACVQASHLWESFERQQISLWFHNYRRYINGVDPHSRDKTLNVTAVGVLHTTELPQYHGEGTTAAQAPAPEPQPKPAAKPKPKLKPKGKAENNLADYHKTHSSWAEPRPSPSLL